MWLLLNVYYPKFVSNNYTIEQPQASKKITQHYMEQSDMFSAFAAQNITIDEKHIEEKVKFTFIYSTFSQWLSVQHRSAANYPMDSLVLFLKAKYPKAKFTVAHVQGIIVSLDD